MLNCYEKIVFLMLQFLNKNYLMKLTKTDVKMKNEGKSHFKRKYGEQRN